MASTDHQQNFDFGGKPSGKSAVNNKFDGAGNPSQSTKTDKDLGLEPNKFPRQGGHDSLTDPVLSL